ncbi:lysophospholipase [Burkholderiales bacterium JOSHI_001]|nr:lysophospholipase [Burkholderiales bacterium JOSHI_001]
MNSATPWVLLRGLSREAAHWGPFVQQLAQASGQPVLTLDLPGAGVRHREPSPMDVPRLATACAQELDRLGHRGPLCLLGLSMGGLVAADWARQQPQQVQRLVMVNSSLAGLNPPWQRLRPAAWPGLLRIALQWQRADAEAGVLQLTSARPAAQAGVLPGWQAIRRQRPVSAPNALRQLVAAARCRAPPQGPPAPLLVVASASDALVNPACSRTIASTWAAPLAWHPWAGHDLPLDDGAWLASAVARWSRAPWRPMP